MDKQEFALESFKNIQELIRFIDQKSGAVLVVAGLILTVYLEFSKELVFKFSNISFVNAITFIFGVTTGLLLVYVIYLSILKILIPRLAKHYEGSELSLLYFNHLATMADKSVVLEQFNKLNDVSILKNLTDQIFEISKILDMKIIQLNKSMNCLFYSIVSLLAFVLASRFI
jgi:Family of unknown function (DUF5706)